jgi:hypothetical protein
MHGPSRNLYAGSTKLTSASFARPCIRTVVWTTCESKIQIRSIMMSMTA